MEVYEKTQTISTSSQPRVLEAPSFLNLSGNHLEIICDNWTELQQNRIFSLGVHRSEVESNSFIMGVYGNDMGTRLLLPVISAPHHKFSVNLYDLTKFHVNLISQ